jgi:hypothetical protein
VRLAAVSGLSEPTVRKAIKQLKATKWFVEPSGGMVTYPQPPIEEIPVPKELLVNRNIEIQARIIYCILSARAYFPKGHFTYVQLSRLTKLSLKTVRRAVKQLMATQWMKFEQVHFWVPVRFALQNPIKKFLYHAMTRLRKPQYLGETLMQVYLSLISGLNGFVFNPFLDFLVNPDTGELMQLDAYSQIHKIGVEFNGAQHYVATDFATEEQVAKQMQRDKYKKQICDEQEIKLVTILPEDLSLDTIKQKIGNSVPIQDLRPYEMVIAILEKVCERYRRKALDKSKFAANQQPQVAMAGN